MSKVKLTFIWRLAIPAAMAVAIASLLLGLTSCSIGSSFASVSAQDLPPAPPPPALGAPTGLTAVPGVNAGDVLLNWIPAAHATYHLVYLAKPMAPTGSSGRLRQAMPHRKLSPGWKLVKITGLP